MRSHEPARRLVRDDLELRKRLLVHLAAVPVVPVPVRLDEVAHRLRRDLPEVGEHGARRVRRAVGVDDQHAVVGHDRDRVAVEADVAIRRGPE